MSAGRIVVEGFMPALDLNGAPVPGAKLAFYENKSSTLATVYEDFTLTVPHTNPVVADASGQFPSIFADAATLYTITITDGDDVPVGVGNLDDVRAIGAPDGGEFALDYEDAVVLSPAERASLEPVSPRDFLQAIDANWTNAINKALATGRPVKLAAGDYDVNDQLSFHPLGNSLRGDGVGVSRIVVDSTFNTAARAICFIPNTASENGAGLADVGIHCEQPNTVSNYISSIAVSAGGSGYTTPPTVTITGGGGKRATAVAVLGSGGTAGQVVSFTITCRGEGYTSTPTVTLTGGGGTGATAGTVTRTATASAVTRADIIRYPWAVSAVGVSRLAIPSLKISGAWNGLDIAGNTGGTFLGALDIGAANIGVRIGGAILETFEPVADQTVFTLAEPPAVLSTLGVYRVVDDVKTKLTVTTDYSWSGAGTLTLVAEQDGDETIHVQFEAALDFITLVSLETWCFGFIGASGGDNRTDVYRDGGTTSLIAGRADGLNILALNSFEGLVWFQDTGGEGVIGNVSSLKLDTTYAKFRMDSGRVTIGQFYSTSLFDDYSIRLYGGHLSYGNGFVAGAVEGEVPLIENFGGFLQCGLLVVANLSPDAPFLKHTNGVTEMTAGFQCIIGTDQERSEPFIKQVSGPLMITSGYFTPKGSGTGYAIEITTNEAHRITHTNFAGWGVTLPTMVGGDRQGLYGPNIDTGRMELDAASILEIRADIDDYDIYAGDPIGVIEGTNDGQEITLRFFDDGIIVSSEEDSSIQLQGMVSHTFNTGDVLILTCVTGTWWEASRSINSFQPYVPPTMASASTLAILETDLKVFVTGTATISTITGHYAGQPLVLYFNAAAVVEHLNPNIKLRDATDRTMAANTALRLEFNGSVWIEV